MSSSNHSKKRDSALLYEFLVRSISSGIVDGDQKKSSQALKLLKRYYAPGTELYREFRLANSLFKTTVSSDAVAGSILREASLAAQTHDVAKLDKEKTSLIHNINRTLNQDGIFYEQEIPDYRVLATIQTLINEWRISSRNSNISLRAKYEDQLVKWLTSVKPENPDTQLSEGSEGSSRLLMRVMMKKLNEKYNGVLTNSQKELIRAYAFSSATDNTTPVIKKMQEIRSDLVRDIDDYVAQHNSEQYIVNKMNDVRTSIIAENIDVAADDATVAKHMLYAKLCEELISEDDEMKKVQNG